MNINSMYLTDGYKTGHHLQYPKGTEVVFSNFTPRSLKHSPVKDVRGVVVFGVLAMLKDLHKHFNKNFFKTKLRNSPLADKPKYLKKLKESVIKDYKKELELYLNMPYDTSHIEALWDLGYLPIEVRSLDEGTLCPIKIPMLTIHNTLPEFYWLPNFLESIISQELWKPVTSATIAKKYRQVLDKWAYATTGNNQGVDFQAHDFSMRGLDSLKATINSGMGHLTSFLGTDSLPALIGARKIYKNKGLVGSTIPATEHSVMCSGGKEFEIETFRRLITEVYPDGYVSIVSDTWDLWKVLTEYAVELKQEIENRDGKVVFRPDSGNPVDILCGAEFSTDIVEAGRKGIAFKSSNKLYSVKTEVNEFDDNRYDIDVELENLPATKGVVELLWDIFGGHVNELGYKVLNPKVGVIYGDSITVERAEEIFRRLREKGFASTNVVIGVGSYTYQYTTRDSFGFVFSH